MGCSFAKGREGEGEGQKARVEGNSAVVAVQMAVAAQHMSECRRRTARPVKRPKPARRTTARPGGMKHAVWGSPPRPGPQRGADAAFLRAMFTPRPAFAVNLF